MGSPWGVLGHPWGPHGPLLGAPLAPLDIPKKSEIDQKAGARALFELPLPRLSPQGI